jgi:hypothetical protein
MQRAIRISDWRVSLDVMREFVPEYTPGPHLLPAAVPVERHEIASGTGSETTEVVGKAIIAPAPAQ